MERRTAEKWLKQVLGTQAEFRSGQWEAIDALVNHRQRVLVVQRTGWGKSLVYFLATRMMRSAGAGTTLLISPLLSLMRNQLLAASSWGLRADTINSDNPDEHRRVTAELLTGDLDLLFISPERLSNDKFQRDVWSRLQGQIGMLVIDEAHCISDWGHDFRPNYRRIMGLLDELPSATPVLGTTATANDRVVADVAEIMGAGMNIQRGTLTRESLSLYVYTEPMDTAIRLTLLTHLMKNIPGSGIIYCTTTRDCKIVAEWLQTQGFPVKPYFADVEEDTEESRAELENQLLTNEVKALVSSVALGMGFDKPDLHFVIHFQQPGNIISYYQQIGRAGRGIDRAYIILMHGPGDEDIQNYFIETAFPKPQQVEEVIAALREAESAKRQQLHQWVNVRYSVLEKILTHLEVERIVEKVDSSFHLVNPDTTPDFARWEAVTRNRHAEMEQMRQYIDHKGCLMRFIAEALDDPTPIDKCGSCKNCAQNVSKFEPNPSDVEMARGFLRQGKPLLVEPRKRWPSGMPGVEKSIIRFTNQTGLALCGFYDSGWGEIVRQERFVENHFSDELVELAAEALRSYWKSLSNAPEWVTAVPSLRRPQLVPDFARRLAQRLNFPYQIALKHIQQHPEQKSMQNSFQQATNVLDKFAVQEPLSNQPVLLVDDIADSRWTLTIAGHLLQAHGCTLVYPFVLASTNTSE
jgi:ATP-dependent DNA helicase RecQ